MVQFGLIFGGAPFIISVVERLATRAEEPLLKGPIETYLG